MKKTSWFAYGVKNYSETYCISMKWFKVYIQVLLPIRIFFSVLSFISSLGNIHGMHVLYGTELSDTVVFGLITDIVVFFLRCYTYTSMKNLKSNGYQSNIVIMIAEIIIIAYTYLSISISYGIIPVAIYIIIWFVPNYIYFKKRQSIFGFMFSYPENDNAVKLIDTKQKQGIETSNNTENTKSNELKFCNKCGSKLDDDFAFCNKCGNKVR